MQQRVPNAYLGRISALEGAAYTVSESASSVFGGEDVGAPGGLAGCWILCGGACWVPRLPCRRAHNSRHPAPTLPHAPHSYNPAGAAFDVLHLALHDVLLILTAVAAAAAVGWSLYAWAANRSGGGAAAAYMPVRQRDADDT